MRAAIPCLIAAACLLAACGGREVLLPKSGANPAGIDFSGLWRLRTDADSDEILRNPQLEQYGRGSSRSRPDVGGLVHVFLQSGEELKITQTATALFISFDRAVVEEFRFGEHRQVQVGPVLAVRVSGWEGTEYVVETLDESGMKLTERLAFGADRNVLRRTIVLRGRNMEAETIVQTFDRAS
jgi:hypothetical protein